VRPIETPDALYEVNQDSWYGFPTSTPAGQRRTEYNQDNDNPIGFRCSCSISASSASRARQVLGDQPEPRPEVTCEGGAFAPPFASLSLRLTLRSLPLNRRRSSSPCSGRTP
jgi:hypothetical protein